MQYVAVDSWVLQYQRAKRSALGTPNRLQNIVAHGPSDVSNICWVKWMQRGRRQRPDRSLTKPRTLQCLPPLHTRNGTGNISAVGQSRGVVAFTMPAPSSPITITTPSDLPPDGGPAIVEGPPPTWPALQPPFSYYASAEDAQSDVVPSGLTPMWKLLLLSDGSVTRHLQLLSGSPVSVECLSMRNVGFSLEGLPEATELIPGPRVQRQVLLRCRASPVAEFDVQRSMGTNSNSGSSNIDLGHGEDELDGKSESHVISANATSNNSTTSCPGEPSPGSSSSSSSSSSRESNNVDLEGLAPRDPQRGCSAGGDSNSSSSSVRSCAGGHVKSRAGILGGDDDGDGSSNSTPIPIPTPNPTPTIITTTPTTTTTTTSSSSLPVSSPPLQPLVYASSWWNADTIDEYLRDKSKPIWVSLSQGHVELYREVHALFCGDSPPLEELLGCSGPFWGRQYVFWSGGRPLTLIYEVFSPQLQRYLGPAEPGV